MIHHPAVVKEMAVFKYLDDARQGLIPEASKFGHESIDTYLRFKRGNFIVVTGHANVGKTHTMLYLMLLHTLNNGTKWLVYSSENNVRSIQRKLIEFKAAKPIASLNPEAFKAHFDWVQKYFVFIDGDNLYDIFQLLEVMSEVADEWKFDGVLIDPYNSLTINQKRLGKISTHDYHYEATSNLRVFCKKHDAIAILNTHPVTQALRKLYTGSHEYAGHPMPPMASDVEGGSKFVNRSDEFIVIHRMIYHPYDWIYSDIHIRKVKELETGGRPTPLDNPIRLESMRYNCGYLCNGASLINLNPDDATIPF